MEIYKFICFRGICYYYFLFLWDIFKICILLIFFEEVVVVFGWYVFCCDLVCKFGFDDIKYINVIKF